MTTAVVTGFAAIVAGPHGVFDSRRCFQLPFKQKQQEALRREQKHLKQTAISSLQC